MPAQRVTHTNFRPFYLNFIEDLMPRVTFSILILKTTNTIKLFFFLNIIYMHMPSMVL